MTNFDNNESKAVFGYDTLNQVIDEGIKAGKLKPLFKNLWFEQELTMLFGVTNVGKSILAVVFCRILKQDVFRLPKK